MIRSFKHKGLRKFFETGDTSGINVAFADRLTKQLTLLDAVSAPNEMAVPGWQLHPLKGELKGHWSVSLSGNWRLTFRFIGEDVEVVNLQDYHETAGGLSPLKVWLIMPMYNAAHPGAILREWMGDDITVTDLAKHLGVSRPTLSNILNGSAGVTAPMAIKLAEVFPATTARLWVTLQSNYELSRALREERQPLAALRPVSKSVRQGKPARILRQTRQVA